LIESPVYTSLENTIDVEKIRGDFPILNTNMNGKPLVYFDNAATTHKPRSVVESLEKYYFEQNANIHRGVHRLSVLGTELYEESRDKAKDFIGASKREEVIFTKGTTDSINLIAYSWGNHNLSSGDEILLTEMEHHANIVPWQLICERKGCRIKYARINDDGSLDLKDFKSKLSDKTKLVSFVHVSNALGTINDAKGLTELAKQVGATVLVDGAQSVQHEKINVQDIGCDFFVFSGHKLYGPTGIGYLWGKEEILDKMPPFISGGDMIKKVTFEGSTFNDLPYKFEAGTPSIAPAIGMAAAIDYIETIGIENIAAYEKELTFYLQDKLLSVDGVKMIGMAERKTSVCSFIHDVGHSNDIGTMLDLKGIAVRTGHHCAMPLMDRMGVSGTTRASLSFYNTKEEIDYFIDSLRKTLIILN
jgi:cysteine desulfurase/selenocysteine lyase